MPHALPASLVADLQRRLGATQRAQRLPSISAAVAQAESLLFAAGAGVPVPAADVQFRIGSITKTFTAVLVMQLRDEGKLRLDDSLHHYLPGTPMGHLTLRALLSHTSGLTSEPVGPFWEATGRTQEELMAGLRSEDLVLAQGRTFHYSNVGYALLGQVIERLRGVPWKQTLDERLLAPLALQRTTYAQTVPHADGWRVHPFADTLRAEPLADTGAMAPAGQLWSTPTDLVQWGMFLADPVPEVLHADTVAEMAEPVALSDLRTWTTAYGLGLQLFRHADRIFVGHGGSMPGFAAGLMVARNERIAGAVVANVWGGRPRTFLQETMVTVLEERAQSAAWHAETAPDMIAPLLGTWWYRGIPVVITYRDRALYMGRPDEAYATDRFVPDGPDRFRGSAGSKAGELLHVVRDDKGAPVVLDVNTWLLTRTVDDPRGGP